MTEKRANAQQLGFLPCPQKTVENANTLWNY